MSAIDKLRASLEGIKADLARKDAMIAAAEKAAADALAAAEAAKADAINAWNAAEAAVADAAFARAEFDAYRAEVEGVADEAVAVDKMNEPAVEEPTDPGVSTGGIVDA